ncbi:hypothetical protein GOP47_0028995 [Adiantum capillus-veneris]|nr:hypothetical protein GOP47_0028995 [Adiantum capillus-veneris]
MQDDLQVAMQERELMKAGILGANEQDAKQLGGRPRFIRPQNNMNTDNTNNTSLSNNPSNNNNNNSSNTNTNSTSTNPNNNQPPALRCPRCDSANTKFCYYNNYSLLQPRYFCKSCRRYWTKGGALRNVPVGGGCRKNKRITSRQRVGGPSDLISSSSSTSFLSHPHLDHHPSPFSPFGDHALNTRPPPPLSLLQNHPHDHHPPPHNLLYFNLPPNDPLMKDNPLLNQSLLPPPPMPHGHHELHPPPHAAAAGLFSRQLASYLPSSIASQYLSNVGSLPLHHLQQGFSHDYLSANPAPPGTDHQQLMQHTSFNSSMNLSTAPAAAPPSSTAPAGSSSLHDQNMGFKAFSLPFDNLNTVADHEHQHWATNKIIPHEQKLLTDQKLNLMSNQGMENQANMELGPSRIYTQLRPAHSMQSPKAEEGWPSHQHEAPASSSVAHAGDQAANYWNSGGWNDMSGYNPGADHPFM